MVIFIGELLTDARWQQSWNEIHFCINVAKKKQTQHENEIEGERNKLAPS